jgi:hypothetical protein
MIGVRTACFVAQFTTDFHLGCERDDGDADTIPGAGLERFVDITWIAGGE